MAYRDKPPKCYDCGTASVLTTGGQEFLTSKRPIAEVARAQCRAARKTQRCSDGAYGYRSRSWR